jgi:hypothetical protein
MGYHTLSASARTAGKRDHRRSSATARQCLRPSRALLWALVGGMVLAAEGTAAAQAAPAPPVRPPPVGAPGPSAVAAPADAEAAAKAAEECAEFEWTLEDKFSVLVGWFLTPYGIWNVDHGSPVLIASSLPDFFASEYCPTHQLGLQLRGQLATGKSSAVGWSAYVSNGRSVGQGDVDGAKNLGGRLRWTLMGDRTTWDSGTQISAYNLSDFSAARRLFDQVVLGMSADEATRYWVDRKIRGGARPPKKLVSPAMVRRAVASEAGSIGYIPCGDIEPTVKVVAWVPPAGVLSP